MKTKLCFVLLCLAMYAPKAFSQTNTLANYDFNSGASYPLSASSTATNITCSATSSEAFQVYTGSATGSSAFVQNSTAGNALAMANSGGTNTRYFIFQLGGSELNTYQSYKLYMQPQRSSTGATAITLAYSTDGNSYTNFATTYTVGTAFTEILADLSGVTAINNASSVYLKLMVSGASQTTGTIRIDNFQVQATKGGGSPWQTNGSDISFNGKVGIGTTNPAYPLEVVGNAVFHGNMQFPQYGTGSTMTAIFDQAGNLKVGPPPPPVIPQNACNPGSPDWAVGGNNIASLILADKTIGTCDQSDFVIKTFDQKRVWIKSADGAMGIGTSTPATALHVIGDATISNLAQGGQVHALLADANGKLIRGPVTTASTVNWVLGGNDLLTNPTQATEYFGTHNATDLIVASNNTPRIAIGANGNIGFGSATVPATTDFEFNKPNADFITNLRTDSYSKTPKLRFDNGTWNSAIYLNSTTNGPSALVMDWGTTGTSMHALSFNNGNMLIGDADALPGDASKGYDIYTKLTISATTAANHGANPWNAIPFNIINPDLTAANKSIFKVDGFGYTIIGVDHNFSENALDIVDRSTTAEKVNFRVKTDGTMYAREIFVRLTNFPDYVFKNEYKLMPLSEVEKFVKQNSHLPNVPSAKDVEENGANMGDIQKANLEKTEELYLYLFELNKKIEKLQEENKELKKALLEK